MQGRRVEAAFCCFWLLVYLTREFHEELFIVVAAIYVGLCFFCLALLALMLALVLLILGPIFSFADGDGW